MRLAKRGLLLAACAAALISVSAGARAQSWTDIVAAAKKEGKLVLYSATVPALLNRLRIDFEAANPGIQMEVARMDSGPMLPRLDMERQTGADGADMMISTELGWLARREAEGALRKPSGPDVDNWPKQFLSDGGVAVLALEPLILAYNTDSLKTPVTSFQDLLRPDLRGRIGTSTLAATTLIAWYDWLEQTQGPDFLAKFAAQKPKLYAGAVGNTQSLASGEIVATAFTNTSVSLPMIDQGAPIKLVYPNPGFGIRYGAGILAWGKHPNASLVAMNYFMSRRGQTTWAGPGGVASPLPNIPNTLDARTITPFDPLKYPPEAVKAYTEKWNKLFLAQ